MNLPKPAISSLKDRRSILKYATAATISAAAFGVDVDGLKLNEAFAQAAAVDVGGGDFGILNYAYALEQLEAAFYTQVLATPYRGMSAYEAQVLTGIRDHEITHRDTLALTLTILAIPALTPNFSRVDFSSRASVLGTARAFEDLGVSAYNGGGQYITNPLFLAVAGSIVSVEARHAALIRDMLRPHSTYFAGDDIIDRAGLDVARLPSQVLPIAAPYVATPLSASQLP